MGELVFKIGGLDLLPYIAERGIRWKRNDVDSADAGEMLDGTLRRDRIIMRRTMEITIKNVPALTTPEISKIMKAIHLQWVTVEFNDPLEGKVLMRQFYSNNVPATASREIGGVLYWDGFTFPLIERGTPD